jgi:hypothetical protein
MQMAAFEGSPFCFGGLDVQQDHSPIDALALDKAHTFQFQDHLMGAVVHI